MISRDAVVRQMSIRLNLSMLAASQDGIPSFNRARSVPPQSA
jgi:hypothetical protein